ncbi:AAA family ATPase [Vagococcus fluvialis]|uniref:AAA family ATPase n=1 Tax=Vagococcus fluvialis TaxID=2738 RepID=UPI0037DC9FD0
MKRRRKNEIIFKSSDDQPSNVLILDEPTNFIDLKTIEALEGLIKSYQGTVIFTSHDSYFVENVATEIYEFKNHKLILR